MADWTPAEANAALPELAERIARVLALLDSVRREEAHRRDAGSVATNGRQHLETAEEAARTALLGLEAEGVDLCDADRGLVELHAVSPSGRPYRLSWTVGEPQIAWWTWPGEGPADRKPLSEPPA